MYSAIETYSNKIYESLCGKTKQNLEITNHEDYQLKEIFLSDKKDQEKFQKEESHNKDEPSIIPFEIEKHSDEMTEDQVYDAYIKTLKSWEFLGLFLVFSFSFSSTYIYQMNIKNFGLKYFDDKSLSQSSFCATLAFFIMRFGIGAIVDKIGMKIS